MILITGATGHLGKATVDALHKRTDRRFAVMVRDIRKADEFINMGIDVRQGDYTHYQAMVNGFADVEKLLLISSNHDTDRFLHHKQAIDAAKAAGVKRIYYTGFDMTDLWHSAVPFLSIPHAQTIDYLKESGISYTILNNNLYADLLPLFIGNDVLPEGICFPAGTGQVPFLTRTDIAEATATILLSNVPENQIITLAGSKAYTFQEITEILSELTGKPLPYVSPDRSAFLAYLLKKGQPEWLATYLADMAESIRRNEFNTNHTDIARYLLRPPTSMKDYLRRVYLEK
ncbi:SDR family oxidoreductase [Spirosoma foliorum]|uniref:SDR family oxidoreductase n=1 Tax=Spirosoma foliorum TaxID=2710596 RepID=A0A7G5GVA5_9BACT|nr:SDR family oxidoreductase [Spirosoma foliorum]QMW02797.1 SDR family oxidoreductase [Spirosoma foliorum]